MSDGLTVTPRALYRVQEPWETPAILYDDGSGPIVDASDIVGESWQPQVSVEYAFGRHTIEGGASDEWQNADDQLDTGGLGGQNHVFY
jgi:hypothetical protein